MLFYCCKTIFGDSNRNIFGWTHLAGKATEKRQNFDPSTPPACAENLHFTLNGENKRAPGRQSPAPRQLGNMRTR
jgi:hypothetical protein